MAASSINSPYVNLLRVDQQMAALEADLQAKLAAGDQKGAEADIEQLKALSANMSLIAHEANMNGSVYLEQDLSDMSQRLDSMMKDVQAGNFSGATTLSNQVGVDISDIYHIIVI